MLRGSCPLLASLLVVGLGCSEAAEATISEPVLCDDCETAATFDATFDAAFDATLLVVDRGGESLLAFDGNGQLIDVVASASDCGLNRPASVHQGPNGALYVANFGDSTVIRLEGDTAETFYSDSAWLEEPIDVLFRDRALYVLGNDTKNVVVLDEHGVLVKELRNEAMRDLHDFALGPDGRLYVAAGSHPTLHCAVQVWDAGDGALVDCFGTPDEIGFATALAFGPNAELWVADAGRPSVVRFSGDTAEERIGDGVLVEPLGLALGPDGRLYVADAVLGIVRFERDSAELFVPMGELVRPRSLMFVRPPSRTASMRVNDG